jgi:anti-anti-sigma factor
LPVLAAGFALPEKESGVSITLEQTESLSVIHLEGAIDIASAAELKALLLKALGGPGEVRVSLEKLDQATGLDVTAVELLWAAGREAKKSGAAFSLVGQAPVEVSAALADAGLDLMQVFPGASQA